MNKITINGVSFQTVGRNISITNNKVYVDGQLVTDIDFNVSEVKVIFEGELANLNATSVEVHGDVNGKVDCTSLKCGDIHGDVDATKISAQTIHGNVDATSVKYKK